MFRDICLDVPVRMSSLTQIHSNINKVSNYCYKLVLVKCFCWKYGNCFSLLRAVIINRCQFSCTCSWRGKNTIQMCTCLIFVWLYLQKKFESNAECSKWFEPRSIISSYSMIVRERVKRTVVGDWRFNNLSGSHLQSHVNSVNQAMMLKVWFIEIDWSVLP